MDIPGMSDIEARVRDMERLEVDQQVLLPQFSPCAWFTLLDPRLAAAMARSYNGSMLKIMELLPGHR